MAPPTIAPELDAQYRVLREAAGWTRRERALLVVRGAEAADYLHSQVTNDIEALEPGGGCYAALLDRKGRMQGDMVVLRRDAEELLVAMEPVAHDAVARHLGMYRIGREVEIEDIGDSHAAISVLGPAATTLAGIAPLAEHAHRSERFGDATPLAVGTDAGFDVLCGEADEAAVVTALEAAGIEPVSEGAAEILRVESGRPRFGRDMDTRTIPQEAGINERAVSFTKGCYIGQETVARLHYKGKPNRRLCGLRLAHAAAAGDPITLGDKAVGEVGSAVLSPAHGPIALALVRREAEIGATVAVGEGNEARVVEPPF